MTRDITLLKQLKIMQMQIEETAMNNMIQPRTFKTHPQQLFECDSDTSASCISRIKARFSSSISNLAHEEYSMQLGGQETKQRDFHKYLHKKPSIIVSNPSEHSASNFIDNSFKIFQKSETICDFQGNYHVKSNQSESSLATSSFDSELKYTPSSCKNYEFRKKNNNVSNGTSVGERSARSRLSSQQNYCPRQMSLSVFESKFKVVVTKSLSNIAKIRETMAKGIEPPDGKEDESKRVVRVKEFSNRFSRNYLYPLARQLKDLSAINQINPMLVNQKLLSTYQIIHNALQAYQTYLPSSVGGAPYIQLKTLMGNIMVVCGFHRSLNNDTEDNYIMEFIDSFKINAELTVQKVEEFIAKSEKKKDGSLKIEKSNIILTKYNEEKAKNASKKSKQDRLIMYSKAVSFQQDIPLGRVVQTLARKKFNVKSKYRTATYKHRPPIQKDVELMSIPKLRALTCENQPGLLRSCKFDLQVNEDCIKTMLQSENNHFEKEKRTEDKGEEILSTKEELLVKLLQFILKSHSNKTAPESKQDIPISEILHLVKNKENDSLLKKVVNSLLEESSEQIRGQENDENVQQLILSVVKSDSNFSDGILDGKSKRKEPKITVTGDKNARLICIIDDNSLIELSETNEKNKELTTIEIVKTSSETQTDFKEAHNKTSKATQKGKHTPNIKISRLRKSKRPLKSLDRGVAVNAVQYKLDFYRFCKNNPMYKRSTTCQPWVLMGKLSEDLLNHCFLSVAREMQINETVDKVFQSELQL
ncbi:uncharacterized protein [Euwallacea similis]|uniref:uncharacterized protein n=1 Tax=Euwallacea similis TaxID=1736056 RepID=UPI00344FECCE